MDLISIIVPVYNVEPYIVKCLDSIHKQTIQDYEVIIINDGSTDNSHNLCEEFIKDKPNFSLHSKENEGLMAAWMDGVELARGNYVGFVDSDDHIDCNMFKKLYDLAIKYDSDIVMCDRWTERGTELIRGDSIIEEGFYTNNSLDELKEKILPSFNSKHITNARWNKLYKTDHYKKNIKYCENKSRICEDRYIVPACMFSANSFYYLSEPLYYYVQRSVSNHSLPSPKLYSTLKHLEKTQKKMLNDYSIYDKYEQNFERAKLNYLRLNIVRNLLINSSLKNKLTISRELLNDNEYRELVMKYKRDLSGKMGKVIRLSFLFNSSLILALTSNCIHFLSEKSKKRMKLIDE